jgi:osmotically-inducible protein OsmY
MTTLRTLVIATLAAGGGFGCARTPRPSAPAPATPAAQARRPAVDAPAHAPIDCPTDRQVSAAVVDALAREPTIDPDGIDVRTTDGIVALQGGVRDLRAAERAAEIAVGVEGVRVVANGLQIIPAARTDHEVARSIEDALRDDPTTWPGDLDVEVASGRVTLRGTVGSLAVRNAAEQTAAATRGVTALENLVVVDRPRGRTDAQIAPDVNRRLHADPRLDAERIIVTVDGGVVRLGGAVGTAAQWRRAARGAWVDGVRAVDASELEVRWWLDEAARRDVRARTPAEIGAALSAALRMDRRVGSAEIVAVVRGDVVTLRGQVADDKARRVVVALARNTVGVTAVIDQLTVPSAPRWSP